MAKKVSLRILEDERRPAKPKALPRKKPSLESARQRLGGRLSPDESPPPGLALGLVVGVAGSRGASVPGVVIFASCAEVHVLLDGVRLRRLEPRAVRPFTSEVSVELSKVAGDAQLFARLVEGETVRYAGDDGRVIMAKLIEKCRWGALVARDDGAVIAVGFRKLWPSSAHGEA